MSTHYIKPSFDNSNIELEVGESITLTDTNNILGNYEVEPNENANIEINGNELKITANRIGNTLIKLKKKYYTQNPYTIYYGDGIQKMVSSGKMDDIVSVINFTAIGGSIELNKKGEELEEAYGNYKYNEIDLKDTVFNVYAEEEIKDINGGCYI